MHRSFCSMRAVAVLVTCLAIAFAAMAADHINITKRQTVAIDDAGTATVEMTMKFAPYRAYDQVKKTYPNLYVLFRDYGNERAGVAIDRDSFTVTSDDRDRSISYKAKLTGFSMCRRGRWQVALGENEDLVTRVGSTMFTTSYSTPEINTTVTCTTAYTFATQARDIAFDKTRGLVTYGLPMPTATAKTPVQLTMDVHTKPYLMSAVYKIYGDPKAENARHWVAKGVLKNTSDQPVTDVRISYRLEGYSDLRLAETYSYLPPGGTIVDLYYPLIAAKVTELRAATPAQIYVRYEYRDPTGEVRVEETNKSLDLLGINQFAWTNLSDDESTGCWTDRFNNAHLVTAFVTHNDEVVRKLAGMVSATAGGTAASSSDDEGFKWMEAAYNTLLMNKVMYQTPAAYMTEEQGAVQEIKFPRDVCRDKAGTCIDLAVFMSALAESTGLHSYIYIIPKHAFVVVELSSGRLLPIECTALTAGSTYFEAIKQGRENLRVSKNGPSYVLEIADLRDDGHIRCPELPALPADYLAINKFSAVDYRKWTKPSVINFWD